MIILAVVVVLVLLSTVLTLGPPSVGHLPVWIVGRFYREWPMMVGWKWTNTAGLFRRTVEA
jgi:hypothetical protein